MTNTKTVRTNVTSNDLCAAQGGIQPGIQGTDNVWVTCPVAYSATKITAEDIVNDSAITVVGAPSHDK